MPTFNLVSEPWIPCVTAQGSQEFRLREVLAQAHTIKELTDDSPKTGWRSSSRSGVSRPVATASPMCWRGRPKWRQRTIRPARALKIAVNSPLTTK